MEDYSKVKTDCFGYCYSEKKHKPVCSTLTELVCARRKCKFFKTKEEYEKGQQEYPNRYTSCAQVKTDNNNFFSGHTTY